MKDAFSGALERAIARALERARIEVVRLDQPSGDPPLRVRGRLGPIEIARGLSCWIADGPLPLAVASALYEHPIGRREMRVAGRADHPPPEAPWVVWYTAHGERVYPVAYQEGLRKTSEQWPHLVRTSAPTIFHDEPTRIGATGYIDLYHLDSEDGLQVFGSTLRAHDVDLLVRPAWWARHASTLANESMARVARAATSNLPAASWDVDTEPIPADDDD